MLASRVSRSPRDQARRAPAVTKRKTPPAGTAHTVSVGPGRPLTLLALMILAAGALVSRLVFWQVMQHGYLSAVETHQRSAVLTEPPMRGQITDVNGDPLASDVTLDQVYAVPKRMRDPVGTAQLVAPILGWSPAKLEKLFFAYSGYALLSPHVPAAVGDRLKALHLAGIVLVPQIGRYYPEGETAAQVVGFLGANNHGNYGVEAYYDNLLSGKAGINRVLKDTAGNEIRVSNAPPSSSQDGASLQLSLDNVVQSLSQHELEKAVTQHNADGGTIIVMNPHTGFVEAMASTPSYDPNRYSQVSDASVYRNPAVEWTYEPGSTFKIITMAAGLDSHAITPNSGLQDTGRFVVGDTTLHNWCNCGFGYENMTQVLQHSANVGASWVASRMPTSVWYRYLQRFGLGSLTHVDLADEQAGDLPLPGSKIWTIVNKYTNSFGQGETVTPIQLIRAIAAVANGGILMKPQMVKSITYGNRIIERRPVSEGRVISAASARTLTTMLVHSAIGGEASRSLVKGYDIAAKTGTANIAAVEGGYLQGATIASTVAWAPAYNPKFIVLVILNHPRDSMYGSITAAPVIRSLFQELFLYYHIAPSTAALNQ